MKVAVVHDWFTSKAGGENCVEEILSIFPQADIYCLVDFMPEDERAFMDRHRIETSFIQRLPRARRSYRSYLPLMPIAIEQFDLTPYDLVISTSSAVAKGVITGPDQRHLCYIFSPIRYAWDLQHTYLKEAGLTRGLKSAVARVILHYIRMWDVRTAAGVDAFLAISDFVAARVWKTYRRESTVVYPPVDLDRFPLDEAPREDYYVTASRMVPYKRIPMIVEAFARMPDRRLVVIGDGPDMAAVRKIAAPNVEVLGRQPGDVLRYHLSRARGFIFAAEEDFGIAPIEAQACGTPVLALARGAARETIRGYTDEGRTGFFFPEQTVESLVEAVRRYEPQLATIRPTDCRANAARFSADAFRAGIRQAAARLMDGPSALTAAGRETLASPIAGASQGG